MRTRRMIGAVLAGLLAGARGYGADSEPAGRDAYVRAYEQFMEGDLAGARAAFEALRDLPGADAEYAADAGVRAGWLYEVSQRQAAARAAFSALEGDTHAPLVFRAEAAAGLGQCHWFDDDGRAASSNAYERALALLETALGARPPPRQKEYAELLRDYARAMLKLVGLAEDDPYYNIRMARGRAVKWPSYLETSAREEILRRWLAEHGLSADRSILRGQVVSGAPTAARPYPAAGFPVAWEFENGALDGLRLTQGLERVRSEAGCLAFATGTNAGFGWGRSAPSDPSPALRFGYATNLHEAMPRLTHLRVRMRQSLPESRWRARVGRLPFRRVSGYEAWESQEQPVRGTNWQEVSFFVINAGAPPYVGVHFFSSTPGNEVAVDWVRPEVRPGPLCARKELVLPAAARWAKASVAAPGRFRIFVNGRAAAVSPPTMPVYMQALWNYELDPGAFRPGTNVVAVSLESGGQFLLDGALLCEDGTHLRFDSDASWVSGAPEELDGAAWSVSGHAGAASWAPMKASEVEFMPLDWGRRYWFNPPYKGGIMVEPADGRPQPVYGSREPVSLRVALPARAGESLPSLRWTLFDTMGDGARPANRAVQTGEAALRAEPGLAVGEWGVAAGALASNVAYALELEWRRDGRTLDTRWYELAVCGPVALPEVANPTNYTDGMELKLVWEVDAASEPPADAFISCDGHAMPRPSRVIETPLGRFRQPYPEHNWGSLGGGPCNYISYIYRIEHPGRPHVAIADYPDDTARSQEMRLTEDGGVRRRGTLAGKELGNDMVVLGFDNPLTHEMRQHHCLFFPGRERGTVTMFSLTSGSDPAKAARVGTIRIYEVLNDVPARRMADAPGPRKWIGQLSEAGPRQIFQSCFGSPVAGCRGQLLAGESPVFYRDWMGTAVNLVKRMKFAGENAHFMGQYMYDKVLYPSAFSETTAMGVSGSLRDYGVLLARMFEENGLGLFSTLQIMGSGRIPLTGSDEDVADGVPTFAQVDQAGRQPSEFGKVTPNWIHPGVRAFYEQIVRELTDLYGGEKGWKGIVLHHFDSVGPSWCAPNCKPGSASFDDFSVARFEAETGIKVPVDPADRDRFAARHAWLTGQAAEAWTRWRCDKQHDIYQWTAGHLKARRADLDLVIYAYASYLVPPLDEAPGTALPSLFDYGRRGGIDLERIKKDPNMTLAPNVFVTLDVPGTDTISGDYEARGRGRFDGTGRALAHRESTLAPFSNDGKNALAVRYNWIEPQPLGPDYWLWNFSSPEAWPYPQDDYFADYWINSFVRSNPRMILHPLMDQVLWNGRETSMSKFAQAFRSLPATEYTRLTGQGRDRNVWIAQGVFEGQTYGYVANPYWWETEVILTLADGVRGRELTLDEPLRGGVWRGRLGAYSMRTFRFEGEPAAAIAGCDAVVGETGRLDVERQLEEWRRTLQTKRAPLRDAGREAAFETVLQAAGRSLRARAYDAAYEELTGRQARRLHALLMESAWSPYLTEGWAISRRLPREGRRDVRELEPVRADDPSLDWQPLPVTAKSNRIAPHAVYGDLDGFVYLANRIRVPVAGDWTLSVGHDGGCRVFLDGREALVEPARQNPIMEDRTRRTVSLLEGEHELVVAFDLDYGLGWGMTMRFQAPGGAPRRTLDFPVALEARAERIGERL